MAKVMHTLPPGFREVHIKGRIVYAPNSEIKESHMRFREKVPRLYYQDPGWNIMRHIFMGHKYFFKTDLENAFDSVTFEMLQEPLMISEIAPKWLTPREHFFHDGGQGGLIQGTHSSSYLFETYCRFYLDSLLAHYCKKQGFHYSRYADDILISSPRWIGRRPGPKVREIAKTCGFNLSDKKTRRVDVSSEPLEVLGYVIRGSRLDSPDETMQKLFEEDRKALSRTGIHKRRKHIRNLNKKH